jgi:hypothetical protein
MMACLWLGNRNCGAKLQAPIQFLARVLKHDLFQPAALKVLQQPRQAGKNRIESMPRFHTMTA